MHTQVHPTQLLKVTEFLWSGGEGRGRGDEGGGGVVRGGGGGRDVRSPSTSVSI
jgi:hypothetical protein